MSGNPEEHLPRVRLFAGYAESPIWTASGPMCFADSHLSAELIEDLARWEAAQYQGDGLLSGARDDRLTADGRDLARRLAAELGDGFVVVSDGATEGEKELVRADAPAMNPAAEEAFLEASKDAGPSPADGPFYFYAPLSGKTYGWREGGASSDG
ncbi:hypothetical protein GCM10027403_09000 [Arthrobacter tecti]